MSEVTDTLRESIIRSRENYIKKKAKEIKAPSEAVLSGFNSQREPSMFCGFCQK